MTCAPLPSMPGVLPEMPTNPRFSSQATGTLTRVLFADGSWEDSRQPFQGVMWQVTDFGSGAAARTSGPACCCATWRGLRGRP